MNATIVWLMIIGNSHGSIWSTGPEFSTQAKCEAAAKVVYQKVDSLRWGASTIAPICVRIEK